MMKKIKKHISVIVVLGIILCQVVASFATEEVFAASVVGEAAGDCLFGCFSSLFKKCCKKKNRQEESSERHSECEDTSNELECEFEKGKGTKKSPELIIKQIKTKREKDVSWIEKKKVKPGRIQEEKSKEKEDNKEKRGKEDSKKNKRLNSSKKVKANGEIKRDVGDKKARRENDIKKDKRDRELEEEQSNDIDGEYDGDIELKIDRSRSNPIMVIPSTLGDRLASSVGQSSEVVDLNCILDRSETQQIIPHRENTDVSSVSGFIVEQQVPEPILVLKQSDCGQENFGLFANHSYFDGVTEEQQLTLRIASPSLRIVTPEPKCLPILASDTDIGFGSVQGIDQMVPVSSLNSGLSLEIIAQKKQQQPIVLKIPARRASKSVFKESISNIAGANRNSNVRIVSRQPYARRSMVLNPIDIHVLNTMRNAYSYPTANFLNKARKSRTSSPVAVGNIVNDTASDEFLTSRKRYLTPMVTFRPSGSRQVSPLLINDKFPKWNFSQNSEMIPNISETYSERMLEDHFGDEGIPMSSDSRSLSNLAPRMTSSLTVPNITLNPLSSSMSLPTPLRKNSDSDTKSIIITTPDGLNLNIPIGGK